MEDLPASHPLYGSEQSKSGFGICYQFAIKCPVYALRLQCFQGFAGFVSYSHSADGSSASPKTTDPGMALYAAAALLSTAGLAWNGRRRGQ